MSKKQQSKTTKTQKKTKPVQTKSSFASSSPNTATADVTEALVFGFSEGIADAAAKATIEAGSKVIDIVKPATESAQSTSSDFFSMDSISGLGDSILKGIEGIGKSVSETSGEAIDGVSSLGSSIIDGVSSAGSSIVENAGSVGGAIIDGAATAGEVVADIGVGTIKVVGEILSGIGDAL